MVEIITKNTGLSEPVSEYLLRLVNCADDRNKLTNNAENLNMERAEASADHVKDIFWEVSPSSHCDRSIAHSESYSAVFSDQRKQRLPHLKLKLLLHLYVLFRVRALFS